jgi:hypothetical protein
LKIFRGGGYEGLVGVEVDAVEGGEESDFFSDLLCLDGVLLYCIVMQCDDVNLAVVAVVLLGIEVHGVMVDFHIFIVIVLVIGHGYGTWWDCG